MTDTAQRDLATFRRHYALPTTHDYAALLGARDAEVAGAAIAAREQQGVARLRADGFGGSTLAEAYAWWRDGAARCETTDCGSASCAGLCASHHS